MCLGGLYLEGVLIQRRSFALYVWGAYIWRGLNMAGLIFRIYGEHDLRFRRAQGRARFQ